MVKVVDCSAILRRAIRTIRREQYVDIFPKWPKRIAQSETVCLRLVDISFRNAIASVCTPQTVARLTCLRCGLVLKRFAISFRHDFSQRNKFFCRKCATSKCESEKISLQYTPLAHTSSFHVVQVQCCVVLVDFRIVKVHGQNLKCPGQIAVPWI